MKSSSSAARPITGRFVLIVTVSFFAVVISVNVVMMRLAIATLPGTEVDSAYSAGLAYQKEIRAAEQQEKRDWKVDAHIERQPDGTA
jgi:nitrogen fixation protein FixH